MHKPAARSISAILCLTFLAFAGATSVSAQTLGIDGNKFTVDGAPRFLTFVSYFDYNDVSASNAYYDFATLRQFGVDGIRIFPNWWTVNPDTYAGDTVINPDGTVSWGDFNNMVWYLDRAREYGLLVDISFSAESVAELCGGQDCPRETQYASLTLQEALNGIRAVAQALSGPNYRHVMFDIQNESNIIGPYWNPVSDGDVAAIVQAVKSVDPSRIVMASVEQGYGWAAAGVRANNTGQDVVAYHEWRVQNWWDFTDDVVQDIRSVSGKPIYLQEPEKYTGQWWLDAEGFHAAVAAAKSAGAAAWCFHTRAANQMNYVDYFDQFEWPEWDFLSNMYGRLILVPWGI